MSTDNTDDLATQLMDDIDPRLLEFIRTKVNSFIKWDLVRFFHDNPHTTDTAQGIARYTGRDIRTIEPELQQLVKVQVIEATQLNDMVVYTLVPDPEVRRLIDAFIVACGDRQFRVKAIYHVIQGMHR
jgi:hypothetical protein